ncbi:beta-N-acetylhexosaminidase family protein [Promicromonospora panici]|uniref:beta-N-acetylhexosaminidase family protein n=1 Tax=Promicromonospora panici TaxID=2219658 RepID=UPI00101E17B9|nr:beta-N-acetylglucosaminidase domain-containing protein [Promicromonospora panici]
MRSAMTRRLRTHFGALAAVALTALPALPGATASAAAAPAAPPPVVSPAPQHLALNGEAPVVLTGKTVRVVVDADVDDPNRDLVRDTARDAGAARVEVITAGSTAGGSTGSRTAVTIRVGATATPDVAAALDDLGVAVPADLRAEGYAIGVGHIPRATIVLGGADGDGTFYAAKTLPQLVEPRGRTALVPGVEVVDYPSMPLRGTIEGFYGAPWSHADRLDQLRFYGDVKMNTYVYAPKDDPYHRDRWRDPYPADKLAELGELADEATANHVRFTFALSPGFQQEGVATKICFTSPADWDALIAKFQAVYDAGVRVFHVPFDDISLDSWSCAGDEAAYGDPNSQANQARAQADLLNRVQTEFLDTHEGTYPLRMTPTHYEGIADTVYRQTLRAELQQGIEVMWTGMATVPPNILIEDAERIAAIFGRKAFVWDNYPVNDFGTPGRLHLGAYQEREPGLSEHLSGIVLNPMNQAAASKVVLFTAADFLWNEHAYDHERSARNAAGYLAEGDAATVGALLTFFDLNHLAPTFGDAPWLPQAPALAREIDEFWAVWNTGDRQAAIDGFRPVADDVAAAPGLIRAGVPDPIFQADVAPWLLATDRWSAALTTSLDAAEASAAGDEETAAALFQRAEAQIQEAGLIPGDPRPRPQGTVRLADGVLDVFLDDLRAAAG